MIVREKIVKEELQDKLKQTKKIRQANPQEA